MGPVSWAERAACVGKPTEWWFPVGVGRGNAGGVRAQDTPDAQRAIAVCQGCPVQVECLAEGLAQPRAQRHGIWGGQLLTDRSQRDARKAHVSHGRKGYAAGCRCEVCVEVGKPARAS